MQHIFALKDLGDLHYSLGIQVSKAAQGIHLSQAKYIASLLAKHNMDKYSPSFTPMVASHHLTRHFRPIIENASQFRSILGHCSTSPLLSLRLHFILIN